MCELMEQSPYSQSPIEAIMEFKSPTYNIVIIKQGTSNNDNNHKKASSGITLVHGPHTSLIGTGLPGDKDLILRALTEQKLTPDDIEYVVCPHGHVEFVGNLNLFPRATHVVGYSIIKGDEYVLHHFKTDIPYEIDDDVEIIPTPGHVPHAVSVVVNNTQMGTVAITGSLFHSEEDLEIPEYWVEDSWDPDIQQASRIGILKVADYIVPQYGQIYRVPDSYRGSEMKVVMTP